jgi:hypothetical protein
VCGRSFAEAEGGVNLTAEESRAIASLQRLAERWPQSLMLFSASGSLCVMRNEHAGEHGDIGRDSSKVIVTIQGIPNDGGDW